jgi:heptosyltransferase-2
MKKNKVLIIRFSSFGDIIQCSSVVEQIAQNIENPEIHWATRSEFRELVELNKNVSKVYSFNRNSGFKGLFFFAKILLSNKYDFVYDAHNNLRSNLIHLLFIIFFSKSKWITRSKDRVKRIFLFKLRINLFPKPFKGIDSFLDPLKKINLNSNISENLVDYSFNNFINNKIDSIVKNDKQIVTIVPSAAWSMKRWPIGHWINLIKLAPNIHFFILGGKDDLFCEDIRTSSPGNVTNFAGRFSLIESVYFIKKSKVVISADTGLLHAADVLGIKGISLMGPTAFGFTKSPLIKTMEIDLKCRPCSKDGRGKCSQDIYQKCMVEITPQLVLDELKRITT